MFWLRLIYSRLYGLLRKNRIEREMEDEMRFHLLMRTRENIERGMRPDEAEREARRRFGNVGRVKDLARDIKGGGFMETLLQDLRYGARMLMKNPGFTLVAVITLALGIGANTAIFSLVNGVLLRPLPYAEPERIVRVFENFKKRNLNFAGLTAPGFIDWRAQQTVFEDIAAYQAIGFDLMGEGESQRVLGMRASAGFFSLLRIRPALGRGFTSAEDVFGKGQVVILSDRFWRERFNGANEALGKSLTLNGAAYTIIGVLPAGLQLTGFADADVWVPIAFEPFELENRGGHNYQAAARLKPGVTLAQAQAEMAAIAARLGEQYDASKGWGATLVSMQEQIVGNARTPLLLLFSAVGLVLLIACANVANLLLTRAASREREFAVRAALGAGRMRIVRQLLLESLLLTLCGALLGWLFSSFAVAAVVKFGEATFPRLQEVRLNGQALGFTVGLSMGAASLFGLAPAWMASGVSLCVALKDAGRGSTSGRRRRFRAGLVVTQIALAVVLLIGASLLLRSFARLRAVDFGYQPERLLTAQLAMPDDRFPGRDRQRMAFLARVVERASAVPGVESASSVLGLPLGAGVARSAFYFLDKPTPPSSEMPSAQYVQISANYFQTMRTPLLRGRAFDQRDVVDAPFVAIVNEAFVRAFFNGEEPLGKRLRVMDSRRERPTEIVGVVRDMRRGDLTEPANPQMFFPATQRCWVDAQIVLRTHGDPAALKESLRRAVSEVDAAQSLFLIRPFDELLGNALAQRRLQMTLLAVFAGLALALAAVGIYGVMAYSVIQRRREIGVRITLGAQPLQALTLILRYGLTLATMGVLIGMTGAWALTRWMSGLLFEISPTDPVSFVLIPLLLLSVALLACWWPARRASKVNPMIALRAE